MSLWIPLNVWTIGGALTVAALVFAVTRRQESQWDFMPAFIAGSCVIGVVAFWLAVLLVKVLG